MISATGLLTPTEAHVMAGLVPAICRSAGSGTDGRDKPGHDDEAPVGMVRFLPFLLLLLALPALADAPLTGAAAYGDWHSDVPGVTRHITSDAMPAPNATLSAHRAPSVVTRPASAMLRVPPGFEVDPFAGGLERPRQLRVAPNGDVFAAESDAGRLRILRVPPGATSKPQPYVFAEGLSYPFGIAFWPPGPDPRFVYVAATDQIVRFPYRSGDLRTRGKPQVVVPRLPVGGHATRDLVFSPDGRSMFVSVGSETNIATDLPPLETASTRAWDAAHGLGSAWGSEQDRADVLSFDADGGNRRTYATGLRNCTAEAIQPPGGALGGTLWCVVNERDGLGDDLPPDYATSVHQGEFYGWPWYYIGGHEDPRLKGLRPDLAGHVTVPDVLIQPHSAPLGIAFYDGDQFPPEYRGDAFVTLRGSWNRARRTGYKVIRLRFANGKPTGEYEDFLTGFVASDQAVWARPVGIAVARDGSLLVSEDGNSTIWRIAYRGNNR
jgi:glucose/arabinose dehydrogenase